MTPFSNCSEKIKKNHSIEIPIKTFDQPVKHHFSKKAFFIKVIQKDKC